MRYFLTIVLLWWVLFLSSCQRPKVEGYTELPKSLRVTKPGGIAVRSDVLQRGVSVETAHQKYQYEILDGYPGYYKVKFPNPLKPSDFLEGWISANIDENWTQYSKKDNTVTVLIEGGLTIHKEPYNVDSEEIGIASTGKPYEVTAFDYLYYKIKLPNSVEGWIYAGKSGDKWVEILTK